MYKHLTYMNKHTMHQTEKQIELGLDPVQRATYFCDRGPFELISTVTKRLARIELKNGLYQFKSLCNIFTQKIANFFTKPLFFNTLIGL